jgi:hypothetical protein
LRRLKISFIKNKILIINRMTGMASDCILFALHSYCVMILII